MRVAYLMNGVIGGIKGKSYENYNESSIKSNILKFTSRTHSFLQQEDIEIDYFILSWQPELEEIYIQQYNPIKIKSIPIRTFEVPEHYKDVEDNPRIQAHYSRWYGALEVSKMCKEYSLEHNINYDLLINARLDLCFTRKINLHNFDPSKFHIAKPINLPHYNWPKNNEMIDHIFISNPEYMFKFMELFSSINEYTSPGQCPHWRMCLAPEKIRIIRT